MPISSVSEATPKTRAVSRPLFRGDRRAAGRMKPTLPRYRPGGGGREMPEADQHASRATVHEMSQERDQ